ncbi:MAG: UPF0175 family protein [Candidatus Acidiferrum sp.]
MDKRFTGAENRRERRVNILQVTIELPDDLVEQLRKNSGDIARRMLEAFAVESYRSGALTGWQVQQLLGLPDRFELDALLRRAGVSREYTAEELALDYEASRRASGSHTPST